MIRVHSRGESAVICRSAVFVVGLFVAGLAAAFCPACGCAGEGHEGHGGEGAHEEQSGTQPSDTKAVYVCPMCPGVASEQPGKCPKCGMNLEKKVVPGKLETVIKQLHGAFEAIRSAMGKNDTDTVAAKAKEIQSAAQQIPLYQPAKNKEKIADFKKLASDLGEKAKALEEAARGQDPAAIKAAYTKLTTVCSSCHSQFHSEKEHAGHHHDAVPEGQGQH